LAITIIRLPTSRFKNIDGILSYTRKVVHVKREKKKELTREIVWVKIRSILHGDYLEILFGTIDINPLNIIKSLFGAGDVNPFNIKNRITFEMVFQLNDVLINRVIYYKYHQVNYLFFFHKKMFNGLTRQIINVIGNS
jgi:hypothetical protein